MLKSEAVNCVRHVYGVTTQKTPAVTIYWSKHKKCISELKNTVENKITE